MHIERMRAQAKLQNNFGSFLCSHNENLVSDFQKISRLNIFITNMNMIFQEIEFIANTNP